MPDPTTPTPPARGRLAAVTSWVAAHDRAVLLAAAAFQLAVLGGMAVLRLTPLLAGETILVRAVPVDPRDPFRGDYVTLAYEFGTVPPGGVEGLPGAAGRGDEAVGRTVYVTLVPDPDGRHWGGGPVSVRPPTGGKYLRGTIVSPGRIEFGIESYFVEEGKGKEYERAIRDRRLSAELAVTADGQAVLRGLRTD